jgi:hypothetical protein
LKGLPSRDTIHKLDWEKSTIIFFLQTDDCALKNPSPSHWDSEYTGLPLWIPWPNSPSSDAIHKLNWKESTNHHLLSTKLSPDCPWGYNDPTPLRTDPSPLHIIQECQLCYCQTSLAGATFGRLPTACGSPSSCPVSWREGFFGGSGEALEWFACWVEILYWSGGFQTTIEKFPHQTGLLEHRCCHTIFRIFCTAHWAAEGAGFCALEISLYIYYDSEGGKMNPFTALICRDPWSSGCHWPMIILGSSPLGTILHCESKPMVNATSDYFVFTQYYLTVLFYPWTVLMLALTALNVLDQSRVWTSRDQVELCEDQSGLSDRQSHWWCSFWHSIDNWAERSRASPRSGLLLFIGAEE